MLRAAVRFESLQRSLVGRIQMIAPLCPACLLSVMLVSAAPGESPSACKVTVFLVWASSEPTDSKPPKEIEKYLDQLKKTRKKAFRLEGKPLEYKLAPEQDAFLKLPQGYEIRWSLSSGKKGAPSLRQVLTNPKKVQSVDILKKSPAITHLEKIQKDNGTFLLIVEFRKAEGR